MNYDEDTDKTKVCTNTDTASTYSAAICQNIMRAGKHSVSFQVNTSDPHVYLSTLCGIMRPTTNDITSLTSCHPGSDLSSFSLKDYELLHNDNVDCCLLCTYTGFGIMCERWKRWTNAELADMDEEEKEVIDRGTCATHLIGKGVNQLKQPRSK